MPEASDIALSMIILEEIRNGKKDSGEIYLILKKEDLNLHAHFTSIILKSTESALAIGPVPAQAGIQSLELSMYLIQRNLSLTAKGCDREHLYRRHPTVIQCPRCHLRLSSENELNIHLRAINTC